MYDIFIDYIVIGVLLAVGTIAEKLMDKEIKKGSEKQ